MRDIQLALLLVLASIAGTSTAQISTDPFARGRPVPGSIGRATELSMQRGGSVSIDLRALPRARTVRRDRPEREPPAVSPIELPGSVPAPSVLAPSAPSAPAPGPLTNVAGLDFNAWGSGHPPDTNADVGPVYFIETINASVGVFDKATGTRVAAFTFDTLMSQGNFGNLCDTDNFGDPVVLYDTFEDRWIITDFAFKVDNAFDVIYPPGVFQCLAVSRTGDPVAGGWYFYSINTTGGFGDYPKFGVWPDGIYMSTNMFDYAASGSFQNARLYAFNKAQMYAGAPSVQVASFDAPSSEFTLLPANARLQTGAPPAGSPNYFSVVWQYLNAVSVYKFHVDWNSISTSTLTGPFIAQTATSWSQFIGSGTVANPDTRAPSPANELDTLHPRLMMQNQYSNIGGAESLWDSHTVGASGTASAQAAVRYYQVDVSGGTVGPNATQAFTWSPDTTVHRFMPSVAVDRAGNMALGYSASSATLFPAIRYAGRLSTDPANTISQTENSLIEGTGSQTVTDRWGDYSSMSLDPDGCRFWMANEYYNAPNSGNTQTRIGSFKYSDAACSPLGSGNVQGAVTAGGAPIPGATVALGSRATTTDGSGSYSFDGIASGTYPVISASASGYDSVTAANIAVTDGNSTTQDFSLSAAPTSACPADTAQADFQAGVPANVDLTTTPGDVVLARTVSLDQHADDNGFGSGYGFGSTALIGQTFTAGVSAKLQRVDASILCADCSGVNPDMTLEVRTTNGSLPDMTAGGLLASSTIAGTSRGDARFFEFDFASAPVLSAGAQYGLVIGLASNRTAGTQTWLASNGSVYAGGRRVTCTASDCSISTGPNSNSDLVFRTYMDAGYAASGDLISSLKDSNPSSAHTPAWTTLSWTAATPAGTLLRFQVAGSNSQYGPFNFAGPDGTAATYYTTSGESLSQFSGKRYLRYRAFLSTTDNTATPVLNDASVCFADSPEPPVDLSIANSDGVDSLNAGSTTTYSIVVTNPGASRVTGVGVSDTFPGALGSCTWTCTASAGGSCQSASGSGNIATATDTIAPNSGTLSYSATCTLSASATGTLANTATLAYASDIDSVDNSITDTDTIVPQADLSLSNDDGAGSLNAGGNTTYSIVVTNPAAIAIAGVSVSDVFPPALSGCTWTCAASGGGSCEEAGGSGDIATTANTIGANDGTLSFSATCTVDAAATSPVTNTASLGYANDPNATNNSADDTDTVVALADLSIDNSDGVASVNAGADTTYTIVVTNPAAAAAGNVGVSDAFPASLAGCNWTCAASTGGSCESPNGIGNIATTSNSIGAAGTLSFSATCTVAPGATGSLINTASVSYANDPNASNDSKTDTDTVTVQADVALTLTDNAGFVQIGDVLDYIIEVTNPAGPSTAVATVTDILPAQLDGGAWVCSGSGSATCAGGSGNTLNDVATVPVGGKAAYTYSAIVQSAGVDDLIVNSASASLTSGTDGTPADNSQTDTDIVVIYKDGFEGGTAVLAAVNAAGADYVTARLRADPALLNRLGIVPVAVASGRSADGGKLFTLQLARFGSAIALRVLTADVRGTTEVSEWQNVDMRQQLLEFAWQSASWRGNDGYLAAGSGGSPILIDERGVRARLTHLLITLENSVPWLIVIEHP